MHFEKFDLVGYRKKIGAIASSTNTIAGPELSYLCPTGVSVNVSDVSINTDAPHGDARHTLNTDGLRENLGDCVSRALNHDPHIVILAMDEDIATGAKKKDRFSEAIKAGTDVPVIAPLTAIKAACGALGANKVGLISPYSDDEHVTLIKELEKLSIQVVGNRALDCPDHTMQARLSYKSLREEAKALAKGADAILQLGSNLAFGRISEAIEEDTGLPVIAINQTLLWCAIRTLGISDKIPGSGQLLNVQHMDSA